VGKDNIGGKKSGTCGAHSLRKQGGNTQRTTGVCKKLKDRLGTGGRRLSAAHSSIEYKKNRLSQSRNKDGVSRIKKGEKGEGKIHNKC